MMPRWGKYEMSTGCRPRRRPAADDYESDRDPRILAAVKLAHACIIASITH